QEEADDEDSPFAGGQFDGHWRNFGEQQEAGGAEGDKSEVNEGAVEQCRVLQCGFEQWEEEDGGHAGFESAVDGEEFGSPGASDELEAHQLRGFGG
ncbi:MAG TPA: hypothetical protein DIT89_00245, partial [Planctomycetaceae bacterium]|nr:hypothetical protein [Planctomycetaceae bacterium]